MTKRKTEIALLTLLVLCSAIYAVVTMMMVQINMVKEDFDLDTKNFNDINSYIWLYFYGGFCALLVLNQIQAAFVFYQNFWTCWLTVIFRIGFISLNIAYSVIGAQTYENCEWKTLPYLGGNIPGCSGEPVCTLKSDCLKLPSSDKCFELLTDVLDNANLLIPISILLGIASLLEVVFLVFYRKHATENATMPSCCILTPIDTLHKSVIVAENNKHLSRDNSDQPVDQMNQPVTNPNFEERQ